jgi:hypothetical protein
MSFKKRNQLTKILHMIQKTLILVGPGGIGKSPIDEIIKNDIIRIDPYRLRKEGPREAETDVYYANPKLKDDIILSYHKIGLTFYSLSDLVKWCPNTLTLLLKVRTEWQLLFLAGLNGEKAKAEIFAPVIPALLSNPIIKNEFGKTYIIILNPTNSLDNIADLKDKTRENCKRRGDSEKSIEKRVNSIDEEIDAWKEMINMGAKEIVNWPFPEYKYNEDENGIYIMDEFKRYDNRKKYLVQARQILIEINNELESFFMNVNEIERF